jgi:hypothetical protein
MPEEEQKRFVEAIKTSWKNIDGPGSNEYFRVCNIHGKFCHHNIETFPVWHRAYMLEFERVLQEADKKNGNDGRIGLPYWDWENVEEDGEVVPKIIRDEIPTIPADVFDSKNHPLIVWPIARYEDKRVYNNIIRAKLHQEVHECLTA